MIDVNNRKKIELALRYPKTATDFLLDKIIFRAKPTPFPRLINLFITEACNFDCPMCHVAVSRMAIVKEKLASLSFKDLQKVFDEAERFKPAFQITGGEPLIHPELIKMISYLSSHRMVKGMVTNGLLLERKAQDLVDAGLDFLAVSLDGPDEETQYRRGFVKDSFAKIIQGLKKVVAIRGESQFPNIRVATVITKDNLKNFEKILPIAEEIGADQWSISHHFFYPMRVKREQWVFCQKHKMGKDVWGENIGETYEYFNKKERDLLAQKLTQIKRRASQAKVRISFPPTMEVEKYYRGDYPSKRSVCTSRNYQVLIRGNGDVEMCQGYIFGNIKKESLTAIWGNSKAEHFRQVFNKMGIMPACFRCCSLGIKFD